MPEERNDANLAELRNRLSQLGTLAAQPPAEDGEPAPTLRDEFLRLYDALSAKLADYASLKRNHEEIQGIFESILEHSPECITLTDLKGNLTCMSESGYRIYGCNPAIDVRRYNLIDFVAPPFREKAMASIQRTLQGEAAGVQEYEALRGDGSRFWIESNGGLLRNARGEPIGLLVMSRDITERRRAEALLRTAMQAAESASLAKGNFLANMSHEIRTPMNAVIGFLDLLMLSGLDEVQKSYAHEARNASSMLLYLLNDILDFSKIEAGKLEMEEIPFSIRQVVEDTVVLNAPKAQQKGLSIHALIHSGIPDQVLGDPGRLRQVINNLVSNAIKFTKTGEVIVTAAPALTGSEDVLFSVEDTGIGIRLEHREHIFEAFDQADTSTTRRFGGTGLGLAISRRLVELMQGRIEVESEFGKGSRFWFTARFQPLSNTAGPINLSRTQLVGRNILLVDENTTQRQILTQYLMEAGMALHFAASAEEALRMLRESPAHERRLSAILVDNGTLQASAANGDDSDESGGSPGKEAFPSAVHAIGECEALPIVLLTSVANKGDSRAAREEGYTGYIAKPIRLDELLDCLAMTLSLADQTPVRRPDVLVTRHAVQEQRLLSGNRLLLAEDNVTNQKVVVMMLKKLGHACDIAQNGAEAVEACQNTRYDLIFMDCQMPVVDGFAATRRIRAHSHENLKTPIIAMTANAMMGDRDACLAAGMDDYIPKPVNLQMLSDILRRHLTTRGECPA